MASTTPTVLAPPVVPSKWTIPLTQGLVAYVDEADYEVLASYKWHARKDHNTYYAASRDGYGFMVMHRCIAVRMGILSTVFDKREIDHIDNNGLNNTRINLRVVTRRQNRLNTKSLGKKGVSFDSRYKTRPYKVKYSGRYLGQFATREEAEAAYDEARRNDPDAN